MEIVWILIKMFLSLSLVLSVIIGLIYIYKYYIFLQEENKKEIEKQQSDYSIPDELLKELGDGKK